MFRRRPMAYISFRRIDDEYSSTPVTPTAAAAVTLPFCLRLKYFVVTFVETNITDVYALPQMSIKVTIG